ncbi:MAG: glycosyltransferase family 9 protein [Xanthobacteraceae bacterium]|nr:glycosyltransferase family 9 protein [Xanthobacteraceae bacterium]
MNAHATTPIALPERPRILVISLRRIGDLLLTTPLIRSLRRAWPKATIDVLALPGPAEIVEGNPDIDRIVLMQGGQSLKLARQLFKRYDLAVSTQTGDRPTLFAILAGRQHAGLVADDGKPGDRIKRAMLHRKSPMTPKLHQVEQLMRLCDTLGIARVPEMVCPAASEPPGVSPGENYAVVHAAPMFRYKQWTAEGWRVLAAGLRQRGLDVVAISGPGAEERRYLDAVWQGTVRLHQFSWSQNTALLKRARVYVGPDTSVSHLAAATGCPTVTLFGPMDPRVWGPWPAGGMAEPWAASGTIQNRGNVWIVQNPLPCLPCTFEGWERHIDSASVCLEELAAEQVLAAVDQALAKTPPRAAVA